MAAGLSTLMQSAAGTSFLRQRTTLDVDVSAETSFRFCRWWLPACFVWLPVSLSGSIPD